LQHRGLQFDAEDQWSDGYVRLVKTLLMLGGSDIQVHAIQRAQELGVRVVTCDNRPSNPGHAIANDYFEVSTTDLDGVLRLARRLRVDGVLAYASDPAALTAAFVAERLGLAGDPVEAVRNSQDKLLLRTVQRRVGLPSPDFVDGSALESVMELVARSNSGTIVKPTDSSGSKGVIVLAAGAARDDVRAAIEAARSVSRSGRVIAESIWGERTEQFRGELLVDAGKVRFATFGDQIMSRVPGSRVTIGALCPSSIQPLLLGEAERQSQVLVSELGLRQGVYDIEFRIDSDHQVAVIDFGARIGGNLLGLVHQAVTGFDLVGASILLALGEPGLPERATSPYRNAGYVVIHSQRRGRLSGVHLSMQLRSVAQETLISARPGDQVKPYRTSADRLGVIVIASDQREQLEDIYNRTELHLGVQLLKDAQVRRGLN